MSKEWIFAIFCLESYKQYRHLSGKTAARLFREYGVYDYIRESFDALHTTGSNFIDRDIDSYLASRGCIL